MRWFAFKRIQSSIAVAFSCLILFTTLIISLISYNLSTDAVKKKSQDSTSEIIDQINRNIKSYINSMEYISLMAMNNRDVRLYLQASKDSNPQKMSAARERVSEFFHSMLSSRKDIAAIMLAGDSGSHFVSDRVEANVKPAFQVRSQSWFAKAKEAQGLVVISPPHIQNIFLNEYRWVISFSREIKNPAEQSLGVFLIDLNFDVISEICSNVNIGQRGYIFIVDEQGKIVFHPQQQILYSNLKSEMIGQVLRSGNNSSFFTNEGDDSRMYTVKETGYGWKIVGVAYLNELVSNKEQMKLSFFFWGTFCLVIGLIIAIVISHTLSRPIKRLESYMREIERGKFDIRADITSTNEIGKLGLRFNIMIGKIRELMHQIVVEQEFKRKSELKALQAQINPHFLYNTLDSIVWMAEGNKQQEVVSMTISLAKLLRASLGKGSELIPISLEIEHITSYLMIQKMRYKSKLMFHIDVDEAILPCKTLKLILQPLVENSIYHGIKNKPGTGTIQITGRRSGDVISLKVIDDGVGMEPEQLERILQNGNELGEQGLGVSNVNERLQLYFGERYGLHFTSVADRGTEVEILIPIIE